MDLFRYRPPEGGEFEYPHREEDPLVRVFPFEERVGAAFVLELSSLQQLSEREGRVLPGRADFFVGWPPVLEPEDRVSLIVRAEDRALRGLVKGTAVGSERVGVSAAARRLWQNVMVGLTGAADDLRFVPSQHLCDYVDPAYPYCYRMKPTGLRVYGSARQPIGFTADRDAGLAPLAFSLSWEVPTGAMEVLADRLLDVPGGAQLQVVFRGVSLGAHAAMLRRAVSDPSVLRTGDGGGISDPGLVERARRFLESCVQSGVGVSEEAVLCAREELPQTLLTLAARAVFGGQKTESSPIGVDPMEEIGLDLRGFVPHGTAVALPFPGGAYWRRQGLRVKYAYAPSGLPESGILLGLAGAGARRREVRFAEVDRSRHCYVIGATGTGKSTILFNMIEQDLARGAGVCLLDPHGDLYARVLDAVPPARVEDVILIDAGDFTRVVGINFLEVSGENPTVHASFITNQLMGIFERLYDMKTAGGPVFEQYMRNALLLLMLNEKTGGTLIDVVRIFADAAYRNRLLESCTDQLVVDFWVSIAHKAGADLSLPNLAPYITSKLNQFVHNALLRPILSQRRSTVDFLQCMNEGKILLVNLAKGRIGEWDARFLGMLILGKLFEGAMARVAQAETKRRPFYLYIDEAQNMATDTLASMMAEGRKFGLALTLANQTFSQIRGDKRGDLMEAVLGNAGTLLLFRVGPRDADQLASFVAPSFSRHELERLENRHVLARMLFEGSPVTPFVFETLAPKEDTVSRMDRVQIRRRIEVRRLEYTRPAGGSNVVASVRRGAEH